MRQSRSGCCWPSITANQMPVNVPAGLLCSVCRAEDSSRQWRAHRTRRSVEATDTGQGSSGAAVLRCGEWLILTRWKNLRTMSRTLASGRVRLPGTPPFGVTANGGRWPNTKGRMMPDTTCTVCGESLQRRTEWACPNCKPFPETVNVDLLEALEAISREGQPGGCATACGDIARAAYAKATP